MASPTTPDTPMDDPSSNDNLEDMKMNEVVVEEIEEDDTLPLKLNANGGGRKVSEPVSPPSSVPQQGPPPAGPLSPARVSVTREFGNISPISDLLDDDDLDIAEEDEEGNGDIDIDVAVAPTATAASEERSESAGSGKITPEPGLYPLNNGRTSFPRISDGRSSPILAYSPSLLKSPPSNGSGKSRNSNSPNGGERIQRRPRNIARMLDNISDHSSGEGEEEINNVGVMMAKFTV